MSKFSVRRPLTVFVAVVVVLVLGIVAFMDMTPDLLPNMDLPYMIVVTTYPGASPEKVESEITRPLEQTMATLEHIDTVASTSSENVSMIILSFDTDVNMDAVTVDMLQKVEQVQGAWEDTVSTPYILRINPDMLPVTVAAVDVEGMDTAELSAFIDQTLINQLEGISGVASVDTTGMIEETLNVILSQDKIDELNERVREIVAGEFDETERDLLETKEELEGNLSDLEAGQDLLDQAGDEIADGFGQGTATINENQMALIEGKMQVNQQITEFTAQLEELKTTRDQLVEFQAAIDELESARRELTETISLLQEIQASLTTLTAAETAFRTQIASIQADPTLTDEEKAAAIAQIENSDDYIQTMAALATIDAQLGARGMTRDDVPTALAAATTALAEVEVGLGVIDTTLAALGMTRSDIAPAIAEIEGGIVQLQEGIKALEEMLVQMDEGSIALNDAMAELEKQKTAALIELSSQSTQLMMGDATLSSALTQVEDGLEQLDEMRQQTLDGTDLSETITMSMVAQVLAAQNFSMPAGYIEDDGVEYLVSVGDTFKSDEEIADLLLFDLGLDGLDPIYLTDVAEVFWLDNLDEIYAKINGNNGVMLSFTKQSNYATAEVSENIQDKFEELAEEYDGISFTNLMDQGDYINIVVGSILQNLVSGAVLAIIVLFFFLRDIRPTLITLVSIPISVVFAIVLMYFAGISLNMISLSGLAVSVGMLVDNSVVVIENVYRLRSKNVPIVKAAVAGASQVSGAIIAATLTTVCVFLPIVFVEGLTRQLFTDLALTMGFALLASLIVALTLVPAMSSGMMQKIKNPELKWFERLMGGYRRSLSWALRRKPIILLGTLFLLVASLVLALSRGFSFMPSMDMDQLSGSLELSEEATFEQVVEAADEVAARILDVEGVDTVGAMTSGGGAMMMMGGDGGDNAVTLYVFLDESSNRRVGDITDDILKATDGLEGELSLSSESTMDISALSGSGISLNIYGGDELEDLQDAARAVAKELEGVEGTVNVSDGQEDNEPQISITVDKEKAMLEGLTVAQIYMTLAGELTTETTATSYTSEGYTYEVIVGSGMDERLDLDYLEHYTFPVTYTEDGEEKEKEVRLTDIAQLRETESMSSISRTGQVRYTTVTAEIEEGYNVTLVTQDAERALRDFDMPAGTYYEFSGENETIMEAMGQLMQMLLLGVLLVYLIMVAQFQSLKSPFIVMFTIPLAFTGGLLALIITGMEISVISMIGFVMLVGIIVNNGIVLVDYINQLRAQGQETRDAVIEAGVTRMRPILMTSITTIFGLVFMALGVGTGAAMMQPIAVVCIGGLIYATLLTLYVVPSLYEMMNRKKLRVVSDADMVFDEEEYDRLLYGDSEPELPEEAEETEAVPEDETGDGEAEKEE